MGLTELAGGKLGEELPDQSQLGRWRLVLQQPYQRQSQRRGHLPQKEDGYVPLPGLELGDVALRDVGMPGEELPAHAASCALGAHTVSEGLQEQLVEIGLRQGWNYSAGS